MSIVAPMWPRCTLGRALPYRQNALATTLVQPLVALVQADYYPRVVATAFHWLLGSRHVLTTLVTTLGCDYPSNYPSNGR